MEQPQQRPQQRAPHRTTWLLLALLSVAVVGIVYALGSRSGGGLAINEADRNVNVSQSSTATTPNTTTNLDTTWLLHRNERLGFSLRYPNTWMASTVSSDGAFNHLAFDTILAEGECISGAPCNISSGYCRLIVGSLPSPLTTEMNLDTILADLRTRAKTPIESVSIAGISAYRTKVIAAPPEADGTELLGVYYVLPLRSRVLRAYFEAGYSRRTCDQAMLNVLTTFAQD